MYKRFFYNLINWKNKSESLETPLGKTNLNRMDNAIYNLAENVDIVYNELDAKKLNQEDAAKMLTQTPVYDEKTGILRLDFRDGTTFEIDFNVEKIPVSFTMDSAGVITMITADGTIWTANIGELIPDYQFKDSDKIAFKRVKNEDGSYTVTADIIKGSITAECLETNYLAQIMTESSKAQASAKSASDSADNADYDAKLAQSYAVGSSNLRENENVDNAKYYKEQAEKFSQQADTSAVNAKASEDNAKTSEINAKNSEHNAQEKASEADSYSLVSKSYAIGEGNVRDNEQYDNAKYYSEQAANSASNISSAEKRVSADLNEWTEKLTSLQTLAEQVSDDKKSVDTSEANTKTYMDNALEYSNNAKSSETNARTSETNAKLSETAAKEYSEASKTNADNSLQSELNAKQQADKAESSANKAEISEKNIASTELKSSEYAKQAESYAVGNTDSRENENVDNAKYYYEQAKRVSQGLSGALLPLGTVTFDNLPPLSDTETGGMYNISDAFVTTDMFQEGAEHHMPAGVNIYKTADGKWDILAGSPVSGIKGDAETAYRTGNVNISKADIGLSKVDNTADNTKHVESAIKDGDGNNIIDTYFTKVAAENKVDKVDGKQLSSNDFTDDLKRHYDDSAQNVEDLLNKGTQLNVISDLNIDVSEKNRNSFTLNNINDSKNSPIHGEGVLMSYFSYSKNYGCELLATDNGFYYRARQAGEYLAWKTIETTYGERLYDGADIISLPPGKYVIPNSAYKISELPSGVSTAGFLSVYSLSETNYIIGSSTAWVYKMYEFSPIGTYTFFRRTINQSEGYDSGWQQIAVSDDVYNATRPKRISNVKMKLYGGLPLQEDGNYQPINSATFYSDAVVLTTETNNDGAWIRILGTSDDDTTLELGTGDNASEEIVARQYNTNNEVQHEAKILDRNGESSFPKVVRSPEFTSPPTLGAETRIVLVSRMNYEIIERTQDTSKYIKQWIIQVCKNYPGKKDTIFIASANPNSLAIITMLIYNTSDTTEEGLPRYAIGTSLALDLNLIKVRCINYELQIFEGGGVQ